MWQKLLKRTEPRRFQQLVATIMTVKRAMERPTAEMIHKSVVETFAALTRKKEQPPQKPWEVRPMNFGDYAGTEGEFEALRAEVVRTTMEIFKGEEFTWEDMVEPFFPSTKANYLLSRSKGGAVGYIMKSDLLKDLRASEKKLVRAVLTGKGRSRRVELDASDLHERFRILMERILERAVEEKKIVQLVGLAEALKVRVISKGPVCTYTALKPLQKWLWSKLFRHRSGVFRLIGEEISGEYLSRQLGELRDGESNLSGDYSDATNQIDPRLSEAVVDTINAMCVKVKQVKALFRASLTGHLIEDPDHPGRLCEQTHGQLMGSITSFPILCIVNAAICRRTRELQQPPAKMRPLDLKHSHIAINGDDCVFRATVEGRACWEALAATSGMKPSVGKYYFSRKFLNMNSAQFEVVEPFCRRKQIHAGRPVVEFLRWVPRINLGLLSGLGRSTSGKVEKVRLANWGTMNSVSKNAHTLVTECAPEDAERVFKAYLNSNWDLLTGTSLPWFLPEHLGGLGLPMVGEYRPTDLDLHLASAVRAHGSLPALRPEGLSWKVWEYAMKRARDVPKGALVLASEWGGSAAEAVNRERFVTFDGDNADLSIAPARVLDETDERNWGFQRILSLFCVEALFTKRFTQIHKESKEDNLVLRAVEEEVLRCKKLIHTVRPTSLEGLTKDVPLRFEADRLGAFGLNARAHATTAQLSLLFD